MEARIDDLLRGVLGADSLLAFSITTRGEGLMPVDKDLKAIGIIKGPRAERRESAV